MPLSLQIEVIALCLALLALILGFVRKGMMAIKYSLVWLLSAALMLASALIPDLMETVAHLVGFKVLSNMIFALFILILMLVGISLTIIVSRQNEKIKLLIQEVSLLKEHRDGQ